MSYTRKAKGSSKQKSASYTFTNQNQKHSKKPYQKTFHKKLLFRIIPSKKDSWVDGTWTIDPLTWKTKYIPPEKPYQNVKRKEL